MAEPIQTWGPLQVAEELEALEENKILAIEPDWPVLLRAAELLREKAEPKMTPGLLQALRAVLSDAGACTTDPSLAYHMEEPITTDEQFDLVRNWLNAVELTLKEA